jgi:hypothetical protein
MESDKNKMKLLIAGRRFWKVEIENVQCILM